MKQYKIGYTQGVYDMFHIGHLNLLNRAKEHCEYLIVGVNSDELVQAYKQKIPVVGESERRIIVENIKAVDKAVIAESLDKVEAFHKFHFDAIFIGDDWKNNPRWVQTEQIMKELGVDVIFLPHTPDISSTKLREQEKESVKEE